MARTECFVAVLVGAGSLGITSSSHRITGHIHFDSSQGHGLCTATHQCTDSHLQDLIAGLASGGCSASAQLVSLSLELFYSGSSQADSACFADWLAASTVFLLGVKAL
jgi:hypothetical protein